MAEEKAESATQRRVRAVAAQVEAAAEAEPAKDELDFIPSRIVFDEGTKLISTGCTLLDLVISGGRIRGGGMPTGIMVEISGKSGSGKTAVAVEIAASVQAKQGRVKILDPEGRLDQAYAEMYGADLKDPKRYHRPNTVLEVFANHVYNWDRDSYDGVDLIVCDSAAALSTEMEMEDRDKMGMLRAKSFSEGCRKSARIIADKNRIFIWTNQVRDGDNGSVVTPGGNAIPFYSSLRLQMKPAYPTSKILKKVKVGSKDKEVEKTIGILSEVVVIKSSVDDPFRKITIPIMFGFGIDDIRSNLQYCKDMSGEATFDALTKKFQGMEQAIAHIEENGLEAELREKTIDIWEAIEDQFKAERKRKVRF